MTVRKIPVDPPFPNAERVETGVVQFGDDWPGIFISGDNAFAFSLAIETLLEKFEREAGEGPFHYKDIMVTRLKDLLRSCGVRKLLEEKNED